MPVLQAPIDPAVSAVCCGSSEQILAEVEPVAIFDSMISRDYCNGCERAELGLNVWIYGPAYLLN